MVDAGVDFDIAGLSFYPTGKLGVEGWFVRAQALVAHIAKFGKKAMICETSYPHAMVGEV
jgi:arabinogalactan endo-1,4-beta-galactosidase